MLKAFWSKTLVRTSISYRFFISSLESLGINASSQLPFSSSTCKYSTLNSFNTFFTIATSQSQIFSGFIKFFDWVYWCQTGSTRQCILKEGPIRTQRYSTQRSTAFPHLIKCPKRPIRESAYIDWRFKQSFCFRLPVPEDYHRQVDKYVNSKYSQISQMSQFLYASKEQAKPGKCAYEQDGDIRGATLSDI